MYTRRKKTAWLLMAILLLSNAALLGQEKEGQLVEKKKSWEAGLNFSYLGDKSSFLSLGRFFICRESKSKKGKQYVFSLTIGDYREHHGVTYIVTPMFDLSYSLSSLPSFRPYAFIGVIGWVGKMARSNRVEIFAWVDCGVGAKVDLRNNWGLCAEVRIVPFPGFTLLILPIPSIGIYGRW